MTHRRTLHPAPERPEIDRMFEKARKPMTAEELARQIVKDAITRCWERNLLLGSGHARDILDELVAAALRTYGEAERAAGFRQVIEAAAKMAETEHDPYGDGDMQPLFAEGRILAAALRDILIEPAAAAASKTLWYPIHMLGKDLAVGPGFVSKEEAVAARSANSTFLGVVSGAWFAPSVAIRALSGEPAAAERAAALSRLAEIDGPLIMDEPDPKP